MREFFCGWTRNTRIVRTTLIVLTVLLVSLACVVAVRQHRSGLSSQVVAVMDEPSGIDPFEFVTVIVPQIRDATDEALATLVNSQDTNIAVAAEWEQVRRTTPPLSLDGGVGPDDEALSSFIASIEMRIETKVPYEWSEVLRSARRYGVGSNMSFTQPNGGITSSVSTATVVRDGNALVVRRGRLSIRLPDDQVVVPGATYADNGIIVLAFNDNRFPTPYRLFGLSPTEQRLVWRSNVVGDCMMAYTGSGHWHAVTIRSVADRILVFGASGISVYVEVFDRTTGKNLWRFNALNHEL